MRGRLRPIYSATLSLGLDKSARGWSIRPIAPGRRPAGATGPGAVDSSPVTDLSQISAAALGRLYLAGATDPVTATEFFLDRIRACPDRAI